MSDMIRSGVGPCAVAFVVLFGSLAMGLGQEQTSAQSATAQGTKEDAVAKPAPVPPQEAPAASPAATTPAAAVSSQASGQTPAASQPQGKGKAPKKGKHSTSSGPGEVTNTGVQEKPYEIGPEDVLYLNVLHQPDVSGNLEVRPDGFVSVRFAGEVKAAGLTAQRLSDEIADKLTKYFNHPEVNVQVLRIYSKKYYISGEVHKPGAYPLTAPKTFYAALIEAGGLADFAKKSKIYVLRGQEKIPFNYGDVSKGKNLRQNKLLENGDVIVVP